MTAIDQSIGNRIVHVRGLLGLSQAELAARVGIAATQLSRYESGKNLPRTTTLFRIAEALNVSPRWLEHGDGNMNAHEFATPPKPGEHEVVVDLPDELYAAIRTIADAHGRTMDEQMQLLIASALTDALAHENSPAAPHKSDTQRVHRLVPFDRDKAAYLKFAEGILTGKLPEPRARPQPKSKAPPRKSLRKNKR